MKRNGFTALLIVCLVLLAVSIAGAESFLQPTGLLRWDKTKAFNGYTLYATPYTKDVYLIDMEGNLIHKWETDNLNGLYAVLLPNGNILRGACVNERFAVYFGGSSGSLQELDWNGKVVWEYKMNSPQGFYHHAFDVMPNGNILLIAWEQKSWDEAIKKGRDPKTTKPDGVVSPADPKRQPVQGIWPDFVREIDKSGKMVWEWHVWDHIGTGPDQININFTLPSTLGPLYGGPDWTHFNTVQYLPKTDQVLVNSRNFGEFYIIDKKSGKIVYRWGNPGTHGKGRLPGGYVDDGDQILFGPHHVQVQEDGNITIFDNGTFRPSGNYSRVIEMDPKTGKILWQFAGKGIPRYGNSFSSAFQSSAQKLPNGNFLVTSTNWGHMFEVTRDKKIVWEYINPVNEKGVNCTRDDFDVTYEVHRSYRYAPDYPGLKGKDLTPKGPLTAGCPDFRKALDEGTAKNPK
ncbi:MAG TPA: aryl-sulfate sulfotransferase [Syntrophorhabdales bacterium]|nr:aryl-sulfate sulfotransferase [Syntrophorhabdales bacterium]